MNNNQRTNYQFKIFKTTFIRIADEIKKTFSIIIITRVISIAEATFTLIKFKQNIVFKKLICYNCDKINYYRKNYIIQDQIEANKKVINKARVNNLDIDEEWKINNAECGKTNHYRKNCTVQDQIEADKKIINKARINNLDIDEE